MKKGNLKNATTLPATSTPSLPPEILTQILRTHFNATACDSKISNRYAPTQVSQFWRNAALNDPRCWTSIVIRVDFPDLTIRIPAKDDDPLTGDVEPYIKRHLAEVKWQLDLVRDSQLAIDLAVVFQQVEYEFDFQYVQSDLVIYMIGDFLRAAFDPSPKDRYPLKINSYRETGLAAHIIIMDTFLMPILQASQPEQYECLTTLEISIPAFTHPITFPNLISLHIKADMQILSTLMKLTCPSLTRLRIENCENDEDGEDVDEGDNQPELFNTLYRFPKLDTVIIDDPYHYVLFRTQVDAKVARNTAVRTMAIYAGNNWDIQTVPDFLNAFPNLKALELISQAHRIHSESEEMDALCTGPNVTDLTIAHGVSPGNFTKLIMILPNIEHLQLGWPTFYDETGNTASTCISLLGILGDQIDSEIPLHWPHLKEIRLRKLLIYKEMFCVILWVLRARQLSSSDGGSSYHGCCLVMEDCCWKWEQNDTSSPRPILSFSATWPLAGEKIRDMLIEEIPEEILDKEMGTYLLAIK